MALAGLLDSVATVYGVTEATGAYTTVLKAHLPCRLSTVSTRGAASAPDRAELAALRQLYWAPDYELPEHCQVEIGGVRYNPRAGTFVAPTKGGSVAFRSCDVVRAIDG